MIKVELISQEGNYKIYGVVDYLSGKPVVRFKGADWQCLSFLCGITGPIQLPQA